MIVGMIGHFNGKDMTSYLESYKAEMIMRDIPEDKRLARFPRVIMPSIHTEVLEVQVVCWNWLEFKGWLLERYRFDDLLWLGSPAKDGTHRCFSRSLRSDLHAFWHWTGLFIKLVELLDGEKVGLLLEIVEIIKKRFEEILTRLDETRRCLESGSVPTNMVEGPSGGVALEEMTKMV